MSRKIHLGSVSWGTMLASDLVPAFICYLRHYDASAADNYESEIPADAIGDSTHDYWRTDDADELCIALQDSLGEHATEGCYFGSHPGDGSDFGFWPV